MKHPTPLAQRLAHASRKSAQRHDSDAGSVAVIFPIPTRLLDPAKLWHPGPGFKPQHHGGHAWLRDIPGVETRAIVTHTGRGTDTEPEIWDVTMPYNSNVAAFTRQFIANNPERIDCFGNTTVATLLAEHFLGATSQPEPAATGPITVHRRPYAGSDVEGSDTQRQELERRHGLIVYTALEQDRHILKPGSLWTCLHLWEHEQRELTEFARTAARLHEVLGCKVGIYTNTGPGTLETTTLRQLGSYSDWRQVRYKLDGGPVRRP